MFLLLNELANQVVLNVSCDLLMQGVFSQLRTIFDLIIKFQQILEGFFEKALRENGYRNEYERLKMRRASEVSSHHPAIHAQRALRLCG